MTRTNRCNTPQCVAARVALDAPKLAPRVTQPLLRDGTTGSPTTRREFTAGDELTLVTEVYDNGRRRRDAPAMIGLAASLRDASGKEIPLASEQQPAVTLRDGVVGRAFTMHVTVPEVPEGAYVLSVQASNAAEERAVSREIPVRVRSR
jgi:hypothetical protein